MGYDAWFLSLYYHQSLPQKSVSNAWLTLFWCSLNEIKGTFQNIQCISTPLVKCAHITIFGVSPGLRCHKTHWKVLWWIENFLGFLKWSWPWPWIFKVKYGICYVSAKKDAIATKRKAIISIDVKASNVTIEFDLGHDLDLEFSRSNMQFAISQPKMVRLPRNEQQTYWLNLGTQMWPLDLTLAITLTLNFQGQICNLLYLNEKWSDCY